MHQRLTCCLFLTLTLSLVASAQGGKPTGGQGPPASTPTRNPSMSSPPPSLNLPDPSMGRRAFISGKVVLDDGTPLTESANIQTLCRGRRQTVAHTDLHGGFSFELGDTTTTAAAGIGEADVDSMPNPAGRSVSQRDWRDCELLADLPGFMSQPIELASRLTTFESTDIGRLVLHRMGQAEGLTISATSAMAPKDAQKAYEKGHAKANKENWDEAQQLLNKAVEIYPKYAAAWFDLGRVQMRNNEAVPARHSFEQAIAADPKYVNPYRGLAELDARQQQWPELVATTVQLLALNPINFPDAWLLNSLGNFYLHNLPEAEKSARRGLKVDDQHQVPKLEYLLGMILAQKHEYPEAALHVQNYLKLATQPAEVASAQKQLDEINRLSASVSDPAVEKK
jgi:tetratricopeptide (TPR) repeat protein